MTLSSAEILTRLGTGEAIVTVCEAAGLTRAEFETWWQAECRRRVPPMEGSRRVPGLCQAVQIRRDSWGIPLIEAEDDRDLFFGYGYAIAQDRLFQLDYLRRKARGRLAEVLGPEGVESDRLYRTLGLSQIAEAEWQTLPPETCDLLVAYTAGVNGLMEESRQRLPIEFDLLGYRPEPWSPTDSLAIAGEFRWYLTGRLQNIAIPELVKRALDEGPLYRAFLQAEADGESILPPGTYAPASHLPGSVGDTISDRDEGQGSNNWALAAARTTTGSPLVANDPHVPFGAVSIWHEVHLRGGSFHVVGAPYVGVPGIMAGRNERVAWGLTNNLSSQRDLYQEPTDPSHPGCFLYDSRWEPARERREVIQVRGAEPVVEIVRSSRNGPLVDAVLPPPARGTGPVALRWLGAEACGWVTALLNMNRAGSVEAFREATQPWKVPTFNMVFADVDGHIGHQCVGRIPIRRIPERAYRPGWDPRHQWEGVIPFEEMPRQMGSERGFIVTANNRLAPEDFPFPLSGLWSSGYRARRLRERIEAQLRWSPEDCQQLQFDVRSGRAAVCVPPLVDLLANDADPRVRQAVGLLSAWDFHVTTESVAATLFNVFFGHWCRAVAAHRLASHYDTESVQFIAGNAGGLAAELLAQDRIGWFDGQERWQTARAAFLSAFDEIAARLGPDMNSWSWGRLHSLQQRHFLSDRGDLGQLLDRSGLPVPGDGTTVCNGAPDTTYAAYLGASFRMVADLADPRGTLWVSAVPGNSGHPGSPHYDDLIEPWAHGQYRAVSLADCEAPTWPTLRLEPSP
jgi:penicillin amidase